MDDCSLASFKEKMSATRGAFSRSDVNLCSLFKIRVSFMKFFENQFSNIIIEFLMSHCCIVNNQSRNENKIDSIMIKV